MNIENERRKYYRRLATEDSKPLPKAALRFDPPSTTKDAIYKLPGHGLLFCVHGKSYFEPCHASTCRRTSAEAGQRLSDFLSKL